MHLRAWREAIRDDPNLPRSAKLAGFVLSTYAEHDGQSANPGHSAIGEAMGVGKRQTIRVIADLLAAGYLTKTHIGHSAGPLELGCGVNSTYELQLPERAA